MDFPTRPKTRLKKHPDWQEDKPGTVDWAMAWFARRNASEEELQQAFGFASRADAEQLKKNLDRLDKRIDVARTIALGTNVPDSITAAVNREAPNMVQGIIVFSDGRSNLGSDSSYLELRDRAHAGENPRLHRRDWRGPAALLHQHARIASVGQPPHRRAVEDHRRSRRPEHGEQGGRSVPRPIQAGEHAAEGSRRGRKGRHGRARTKR